jgi:class 3 adenylate cyclase/pimeloyl-ACP methyl ester carboxylesterase
MGFANNFESELEWPVATGFFDRLASFSRLILFDKRGTGLSDRRQTPDLEMRADDLRAALDAVGSERAVLFGESEGGALAAFFAAAHPERVLALVAYGTLARYAAGPDSPGGISHEEYLAMRDDIIRAWGSVDQARAWIEEEAPSFVDDEEFVRSWARLERHAASPAAALEFLDVWYATDVRGILGSVQAPTLVLCRPAADDPAGTRFFADQIPGAEFREIPGHDYIPPASGWEDMIEAVRRFVTSIRAEEAEIDRVLATVLFTDIVGSTETAAALGDVGWKALVERHHGVTRAMLGRYRGREIDTAGDGFFATFDGPARGVRCAQAIVDAVKPLGIQIRAGLHTGEVESIDGKVGGIAVNVGARICGRAADSEVLVSQTVKDLVAGSGLALEDRGIHALKGVPGDWHLHAASPGTAESRSG